MSGFIATGYRPEHPAVDDTYLVRACRLVAGHAELFQRAAADVPRRLRVLPDGDSTPRRPRRRRSRQLTLPLPNSVPR